MEGYPEREKVKLIQGFTEGFRLGFQGEVNTKLCNNLKSARENSSIVDAKLQKEIGAGRIAGPFIKPPFPNFQISPLGAVPKRVPGEMRLIHHLSYPTGQSVNDGIPRDICSVQYAGIGDAISGIKRLGRGAFLAKSDIRNAFRICPIHP